MRVVAEAAWSWMLLQDGASLFLSVVCGTVAISEIAFALSAEEIEAYSREGKAFLERLSGRVIGMPGEYQARNIPDFHDQATVVEAIAAWRKMADAAKKGRE